MVVVSIAATAVTTVVLAGIITIAVVTIAAEQQR